MKARNYALTKRRQDAIDYALRERPTMTPQDKAARRIRRALDQITAALDELENVDPIYRFRHLANTVDTLEHLTGEARRRRAGNIIDLRNPGITGGAPRAPLGWQTIADLSDRDVNYQAIQQWAKQYKAPTS